MRNKIDVLSLSISTAGSCLGRIAIVVPHALRLGNQKDKTQRVKEKKERKKKKKKAESNFPPPKSTSLGPGGRRPSISRSSREIRCPLLGGRVVVVVVWRRGRAKHPVVRFSSGGGGSKESEAPGVLRSGAVSRQIRVGRGRSGNAKHPVVQFSGRGRGPLLDK